MGADLSQFLENNSEELEKYIKQIKSYETQVEIIEAASREEEKLKNNRPDWVLVLWTGIAGIRHHVNPEEPEGKRIMDSLKPGVELNLVREPENKYDRWAIAVRTQNNEMLGYISRFKNESIARLMDHGYKFHAIIENMMQSNIQAPDTQRSGTEDFNLPFSIWME